MVLWAASRPPLKERIMAPFTQDEKVTMYLMTDDEVASYLYLIRGSEAARRYQLLVSNLEKIRQ